MTKVKSQLSKCRIWKDFGSLRCKGYQLEMSLATFSSPSVTPHLEYFLLCRSSNTYLLLLTRMWTRVHFKYKRESRNNCDQASLRAKSDSHLIRRHHCHSFCLSLLPFSSSNHRKEITRVFESAFTQWGICIQAPLWLDGRKSGGEKFLWMNHRINFSRGH